jgi:hypothetical protein
MAASPTAIPAALGRPRTRERIATPDHLVAEASAESIEIEREDARLDGEPP